MIESGIELREIRTFLVLAEELHFGRAADRLLVSPSRVSQTIRTLEARVGGRLFDRTSRSVGLTSVGERVRATVTETPYLQLEQALRASQVGVADSGASSLWIWRRSECYAVAAFLDDGRRRHAV